MVAAIQRLAGKGLVDFPQVDVVDAQPVAGEQFGNGEHRPDAHFIGAATGDLEAAIDAEDGEIFALGGGAVHDDLRRGAIGQLAGVAGGDVLALFDDEAVLEDRPEQRQAFRRGIAAHAFIGGQGDTLAADFIAFLVEQRFFDGDRHDFGIHAPGGLGGAGALLAGRGEQVLGFAADIVAVGDDFGGLDHRHIGGRVGGEHGFRTVAIGRGVLVEGQRDAFHATGDGDIDLVAHDAAGGERDGVEPRRAFAIEREARHAVGQLRGMDGQAAEIVALCAPMVAGTEEQVIDACRVDAGAVERCIDDMR